MESITILPVIFFFNFFLLLFLLHWKLFILQLSFPAVSQNFPLHSSALIVMTLHGHPLPSIPLSGQMIVFAIAPFCSLSLSFLWNPALSSLSSLTAPLLLMSSCSWAQSAMMHTCESWSFLSLHSVISVVFSSIEDLLNHHGILFTVLLFKQKEGEISPKSPALGVPVLQLCSLVPKFFCYLQFLLSFYLDQLWFSCSQNDHSWSEQWVHPVW